MLLDMMRRVAGAACLLLAVLLLAAIVASLAFAGSPFLRGGQGTPTGGGIGTPSDCDPSSSVCAQFQSGQTFVTWDDIGTDGPTGANSRYRLYRSTSPIDAGNYNSATLIASYILNNSAQLFGGNPASSGGAAFTQANRQSATQPMSVLSDLGTQLPTFSGLQVYTAKATEDAYYAVVSTDLNNLSPVFMGSAGPIAESIADPSPIKFADSLSRGQLYGRILSPAGKPMVFNAHASSNSGGACAGTNSIYGDYWEWFLTTTEGWQDGRATCLAVIQDGVSGTLYPSFPSGSIVVRNRDTVWNPLGTAGIETIHFGLGLTPNPLVGPPNRLYRTTLNGIQRMLNWAIAHYGADPNQIHWQGTSMGAISGAHIPFHMTSPRFAGAWLNSPTWRYDFSSSSWWPGNGWSDLMPFRATVHSSLATLGTNAAAIILDDGTTFGGTGAYADMFSYLTATPGADMPMAVWQIGKDDANLSASGPHSFKEEIDAVAAFQTAHRGHAMCWYTGAHDTIFSAIGIVDADGVAAIPGIAYGKPLFKLNLPYLAFDHSSIDDDMGTATRDVNGILDGAQGGCINAGFTWNITSDTAGTLAFTVDNNWMDRSLAPVPTTTITSAIPTSGQTSITLASNTGFLSTANGNQYFRVDNEIIKGTLSGSTITTIGRGATGTVSVAHLIGATITQFVTQPAGPGGGPYTTMTVNVTPRRLQNFIKANGATVNCTATPNGGSATPVSGTVVGSLGVFTLTGITINATGATSVSCS